MNFCRAFRCLLFASLLAIGLVARAEAPTVLHLENERVRFAWQASDKGWRLTEASLLAKGQVTPVGDLRGEYTVLFSETAPSTEPIELPTPNNPNVFPEPTYRGATLSWKDARIPAALNRAGKAWQFYPESAERNFDGSITFRQALDIGDVTARWFLDPQFPGDVRVELEFIARQAGFVSLATPTIAVTKVDELAWATVPGIFAGNRIEPDIVRSLGYGQGLPALPVLARERAASSLLALTTHKNGSTLAVIADPGTAADPWPAEDDPVRKLGLEEGMRGDLRIPRWRLGLSHMNRNGELAGTLYHPVLGQEDSAVAVAGRKRFAFRYTLGDEGWLGVLRHAVTDVYRLTDFIAMKQPRQSLTERMRKMRYFVTDDATSLWRTAEFNGRTIGAQAYLGTVIGSDRSDRDAIKNSDYGAMWMFAGMTQDPILLQQRLPQARAFKLEQQDVRPGFFQGAASGQYFLLKTNRFVEEFGNYVEPVALTYYVLCDLGNILLFAPDDTELRDRLRLGADRLLEWQKADGHWDVAYDHKTEETVYSDLRDFRPTFYGLVVAYRVLRDEKYLAAARRGADWLVKNAVDPLQFLGVCGDNRFPADFATAQISAGLLELAELTGEERYRQAAIRTAKFYLTSVYTHPLATKEPKTVGKNTRQDWEISQQGLVYEHGGTFGSTNRNGPILLLSHAGYFIRMFQLTGEPLFRDLARAGALGRDAFVDPKTNVASYYWTRMDDGPGRFPHHAWWQIGWITDYLLSEAELRSDSKIAFPRGFFTPKVGPHMSYGFAPGKLFGQSVKLTWEDWSVDRSDVDVISVASPDATERFAILLNNSPRAVSAQVAAPAGAGQVARLILASGDSKPLAHASSWKIELPAYGLAVIALKP
jgi:hypothetical protein